MTQYPEWVKNQVRERIAAGETQESTTGAFLCCPYKLGQVTLWTCFFWAEKCDCLTGGSEAVKENEQYNRYLLGKITLPSVLPERPGGREEPQKRYLPPYCLR